jgi:hypothetical protein
LKDVDHLLPSKPFVLREIVTENNKITIAKKEIRPNIPIKDKIKGGGSYKTAAILT